MLVEVLEKRGLACLEEKFKVSGYHLPALFLNPKFKSLKFPSFTVFDRKRIQDLARKHAGMLSSANQIALSATSQAEHAYAQPNKVATRLRLNVCWCTSEAYKYNKRIHNDGHNDSLKHFSYVVSFLNMKMFTPVCST